MVERVEPQTVLSCKVTHPDVVKAIIAIQEVGRRPIKLVKLQC